MPKRRGVLSYINPYNWGASDLSDEPSFDKAFAKAEKEGAEEFLYGDKRYKTKRKPVTDLTNSPNFNTAFKKAKDRGDKEFYYKGKKYTTNLISKDAETNYKNSKKYLEDYITSSEFSVSPQDSAALGYDDSEIRLKATEDRVRAISKLKEKIYTSITDQANKDDTTVGYYEPGKLYISTDGTNDSKTTPVHELSHKAGLVTNTKFDKGTDYEIDPSERAARHIATKYYLNSKGVDYETFGEKEYSELKKDKSVPSDIKQLMDLYKTKEEFIKQLNVPLGYRDPWSDRTPKLKQTDPKMDEELQGIVEKMVSAGESEDDIALVIRNFEPSAKPEGEATIGDYIEAAPSSIRRGATSAVTSTLKTLGVGSSWLASKLIGQNIDPKESISYKVGDAIDKYENIVQDPYDPRVNSTYQAVGEGLGNVAIMAATGGAGSAGAVAKAPTLAGRLGQLAGRIGKNAVTAPGIIGGSMVAAPEWEEAKAAGLDDDQAFETLMKNYLVGQTEAIPIQNFLSRLNKATGGGLLQYVKRVGTQALEEGVQEAVQTYLTNKIAEKDYDPDRDPMFQVLESAKVGGIVGAILPMVGSVRARAPKPTQVKLDRKIAEVQANKAINELTTDPETDATIDEAGTLSAAERSVVEGKAVEKAVQEEQAEVDSKISEIEKEAKEEAKIAEEGANANLGEEAEPKTVEPDPKEVLTRKLSELTERLSDPDLSEAEEQIVFKELQLTRNAAKKIAPEAKPKKTDIQKQIETTVGITKPEPVVVKNPKQALKEQIQQHYKTLEEGVRKGQKMTNENLITKVQDALKTNNFTPKQTNAILGKVKRTNLFTPGSQSKLNDFIDKVSDDAEYVDKLAEAKNINKEIRRRVKSQEIPQNLKPLAKKFASIPADETFLETHLGWGRKILSGLSSVKSDKYAIFNAEDAAEYTDQTAANVEDYKDLTAPKEEAEPEDNDRKLRASLKFAVSALKGKDLSEFDDRERGIVQSIQDLDINTLDTDQLKTAVRVVDNIVENDDLSNTGRIESVIRAKKNLKLLKGEVANTVKKDINGVGKIAANTYQQFARVYGDSGLAAKVQRMIGASDVFNAGSRVENMEVKLANRLKDFINKVNKKYKTDVNSLDNQVKLVAYSELVKNYGDDSHISKVKKNIERTISEYERAGETQDAAAWKKAYSEFARVNTVVDAEAVMQKSPALVEMWKFFNDTFNSETNDKLSKLTEELDNKVYRPANNYTHTGQRKINGIADNAEAITSTTPGGQPTVNPKQAQTSITATRALPKGSAYASNFNDTQLRGYRKSMFAIEANRPKALLYEVLKSPEFEEVVGGRNNAELISKMLRRGSEIQEGVSRTVSNDAVRFLNEATGIVRNLGSARALASLSQPFKQIPSVMTKAFMNHLGGGSLDSFFKGIGSVNLVNPDSGVKKLLDQYTIGVRGERLGGIERGDSSSRKIAPGSAQAAVRVAEKIKMKQDDFTRLVLGPLTKSDVYAARATWIGYYLKSLKEQGVKDADIKTEYERQQDPRRQQAAAYAEQMIAETQVPSNPATLAQISRNENDGGWNFAKNLLLPFSTFSINAKYRYLQNFDKLTRNPNTENAAAVGGDLVEIAAYAGVAYSLASFYKPLLKSIIEKMTGVDAPDDDEEVTEAKRMKAVNSILVNQVSPLAIGTAGEAATAWLANQVAHILQNSDATYDEWKKETGGFVYEPDKLDWGVFALGLEPLTESVSNVGEFSKVSSGDSELDDNQVNVLIFKSLMDFLGNIGIGEADVYNQIRTIYREQKKEAKSSNKPQPKRRRIRE